MSDQTRAQARLVMARLLDVLRDNFPENNGRTHFEECWRAHAPCVLRKAHDTLAALLASPVSGAPTPPDPETSGHWPEHDERRAFVAGAKWWEWRTNGATMWGSDVTLAEAAAEKRYAAPVTPPPPVEPCQWREVEDASMRVYRPSCREIEGRWPLGVLRPFAFCPYCGKPIVILPTEPQEPPQ